MCLAYQSGEDSVDDIVKGVENGDILLSNNIQKGGPMSRFSTS